MATVPRLAVRVVAWFGVERRAFSCTGRRVMALLTRATWAQTNALMPAGVSWHVAMRPGKRKMLDKSQEVDDLIDKVQRRDLRVSCG